MSNTPAFEALQSAVEASSVKKVLVVSWRDLDDLEAGGSELHADEVLTRWARAGLHIEARTSAVPGRARIVNRHGYTVERSSGRYQVFASVFLRGLFRDRRRYDAVVEVWNGMPFFSPIWFRKMRLVLLHHVHGEMWQMTLPGLLGWVGWTIEHRLAPPFYRKTEIATLSDSSAKEIHERLNLQRVSVIPVGISEFYSPGGERAEVPLVVAVGRLVSVKRFDRLIEDYLKVKQLVPNAHLVIAGEGYLRTELEDQIGAAGATDYIKLPGRISDEELRDLYRSAWLVTSTSLREGWGMSLTEAAACGTPSVAVDIAGHRDAVRNGVSGILVDEKELANQIATTLLDPIKLGELRTGALGYASTLTWDATALAMFNLLNAKR